jgi:hypothetical protein
LKFGGESELLQITMQRDFVDYYAFRLLTPHQTLTIHLITKCDAAGSVVDSDRMCGPCGPGISPSV